MGKLEGKIAVITGGSTGIGLATAKKFVEEGAYVYITGRRVAELGRAKNQIGRNVSAVQGDVSNTDDLDRLYQQVKAEKGIVHVVVANAGIIDRSPLEAITPEHFDKTFAINVRGVLFTVQKALPLMTEGGSIVLVSSGLRLKGFPGHTSYSASKAALRSFVRTWASELKDRGIRANTLSPGATDTPIIRGQVNSDAELEDLKKLYSSITPMGRLGRPEEVANAALFLASDDSSFTSGTDLAADGGVAQV